MALRTRNPGRCNLLQRRDMWRTFWRILALPDENFLVAAVNSFDYQRKTMGSLKRSNALFASLPPRSFTLNERLHFIISLKRST